jgi:hypothetical protein
VIIAVMTYTFARVGAVVAFTVEDYFAQKKRWWLRLREKNGKLNENAVSPQAGNLSRRLYRGGGHRGRPQRAAVPRRDW